MAHTSDHRHMNIVSELARNIPSLDALLERAETSTRSCVHPEQIQVMRNYYISQARLAGKLKKFTDDQVAHAVYAVSFLARRRSQQLHFFE